MADTTIPMRDAQGNAQERRVRDDGAGGITPFVTSLPTTFVSTPSIAALTAGQAAGTDPILAANANRSAIKIVPPADCLLRTVSGGSGVGGIPLFGGVPNEFSGQSCPMGALYITGLAAGAALTIWEG